MSHADRIENFKNAPLDLVDALQELPGEIWDYKPSPDRWSAHEIIIHLADCEILYYIFLRKVLAEPGRAQFGEFDMEKWAARLFYDKHRIDDALELIKWLRLINSKLLGAIPDAEWTREIHDQDAGDTTIEQLVDYFTLHVNLHIKQLQSNLSTWKAEQDHE